MHMAAVDAHGEVGLLVNNAGFVHQALFENLDVSDFDRMFAVHVRGTYLMSAPVLPEMLGAGQERSSTSLRSSARSAASSSSTMPAPRPPSSA